MKYAIYSGLVIAAFALGQWRGVSLWPAPRHATPSTIRSLGMGHRGYYSGGGSRGFSGGK